MAKLSLVKTSSGIEQSLEGMISRGKSVAAFLNRVTFAQYKQAQLRRWETENTSEGKHWEDLNPAYAKRKLKRCSTFPGGGKKIMIATGTLVSAATGQSGALLKVVSNSGIQVRIDSSAIKYAPYPGIKRPFMQFGYDTESRMVEDVVKYMMTGAGE